MAGQSPSTLKRSGFTLIGVAAVSAVIGVATMAMGSSEPAAQPPEGNGNVQGSGPVDPTETSDARSPRPTTTSRAVRPTNRGSVSPRPTTRTVPSTPAPRDVPSNSKAARSEPQIPLRVYNNSNIGGLAHRAAEDFRQAGYVVAEIGNYSDGVIPTTTIYYRRGTPEKAQAEEIARRFGARARPRFDGIDDASPGIIVIVTKSYDGKGKG